MFQTTARNNFYRILLEMSSVHTRDLVRTEEERIELLYV